SRRTTSMSPRSWTAQSSCGTAMWSRRRWQRDRPCATRVRRPCPRAAANRRPDPHSGRGRGADRSDDPLRRPLAPDDDGERDPKLAATLQVAPGDTVTLRPRAGAQPHRFRVSGIALVTAPDLLFQPLNPLLGPAPAQPPVDVAIMPLATFARTLAPSLPTITSAGSGAAAVPGAARGTQWQVDTQVDPQALGGSPAHAFHRADQ